jgi:hypothetical protein
MLTNNMSSTSSRHSKRTTKLMKNGKEHGILALQSTGITRNGKFISQCLDTFRKHSLGSTTTPQRNHNTNHTNTLSLPKVQRSNMPNRKTTWNNSQKRTESLSNRWLEHYFATVMQLTPHYFFLHSAPLYHLRLHPPQTQCAR